MFPEHYKKMMLLSFPLQETVCVFHVTIFGVKSFKNKRGEKPYKGSSSPPISLFK